MVFTSLPIICGGTGSSGDAQFVLTNIHNSLALHRQKLVSSSSGIDSMIFQMNETSKIFPQFSGIHDKFCEMAARIPFAWEQNEFALERLMNVKNLRFTYAIENAALTHQIVPGAMEQESPIDNKKGASYDAMDQVLVHMNRDWGKRGANFRKQMYYNAIIPAVRKYVPLLRPSSCRQCAYEGYKVAAAAAAVATEEVVYEKDTGNMCCGATNNCCSGRENGNTIDAESSNNDMDNSGDQIPSRVLVPGAGLGRLVCELAACGYRVEANELSGAMLAGMRTLLSELLPNMHSFNVSSECSPINTVDDPSAFQFSPCFQFFPTLSYALEDDWDFEARLHPSVFPYFEDSPFMSTWLEATITQWNATQKPNTPLNKASAINLPFLQYGDFVHHYSGVLHRFPSTMYPTTYLHDCIVTCFFLDTATNILEYISTISHLLLPNGIWVNAGPLHYHNQSQVIYSHKQLLEIIKISGFDVIDSDIIVTSYSGEEGLSMKPEMYNVPLNVFKLTRPSERLPLYPRNMLCKRTATSAVSNHPEAELEYRDSVFNDKLSWKTVDIINFKKS